MSSINESRSTDDVHRQNNITNSVTPAETSFQGNRALGSVRSSPAATVPMLRPQRANFLSADHVHRQRNFEAIESIPPAMHQPRSQPTGQESNARHSGRVSVYMSQSFRQAIHDSKNIVTAVNEMEKRKKLANDEEDVNDSSIDDAKSFPVLPPILRRNSDRIGKGMHPGLTIRSLPDLRRIKSTFNAIAPLVGVTDPEVIAHLLETYPNIDVFYMSPVHSPTSADYSPYFMQLVSPGCVDIMNYCVVGREFVIRYIKGKKPRCLTLKRWIFEQKVTVCLRENHFFKNFRLIKAFNGLARNLDMRKFGRTKRKLRTILNTCNPSLAETLLLVQMMYLDIESLSMIQVDKELTYTLNEFTEDQEHYTREITSKIERYMSMLLHLTLRTCWDDVIGAGLAVEREERKHVAPKRINELRKMQRRKLSLTEGAQRLASEESSIGQWIHVEGAQALQFKKLKEDYCLKLSRFIYQVDCMLRQGLYQIYLNSLQKTADYLSVQMKTFPSDAEIKALVKGYLGDPGIPSSILKLEDDDDDDDNNDDGNDDDDGRRHKDKGEGPFEEDVAKSDKFESNLPRPEGNKGPPGTLADKDQPTPHKSQANIDNEVSTTTTTVGNTFLSTSILTNLTSDSQAAQSVSLTSDFAIHVRLVPGELGMSDSLDSTSSSSLSDEGNVNPMGNKQRFYHFDSLDFSYWPAHLDDLNPLVITGTEIQTYQFQENLNYQELVEENVSMGLEDLGSENDQTTVVENPNLPFGPTKSNTGASNDLLPLLRRSSWTSEVSRDVMSSDLTITSEERDMLSARSNADNSAHTYFVSHTMPHLKSTSFHGAKDIGRQTAEIKRTTTKSKEGKKKKKIQVQPAVTEAVTKMAVSPLTSLQDISEKNPSVMSSLYSSLQNKSINKTTLSSYLDSQQSSMVDQSVMGLFAHLFVEPGESSVDLYEDSQAEEMLEFPILDGTTWEPENADHYLSVRMSQSSSVDRSGQSPDGIESSVQSLTTPPVGSDRSDTIKASLNDNFTQNMNVSESEVNRNSIVQSTIDRSSDLSLEVSLRSTSNNKSLLPYSGQFSILDFLAKEMEYPHAEGTDPMKMRGSLSTTFIEEKEAEDGNAPILVENHRDVDDPWIWGLGVLGKRKDGGRRKKSSKAESQFTPDMPYNSPGMSKEMAEDPFLHSTVDSVIHSASFFMTQLSVSPSSSLADSHFVPWTATIMNPRKSRDCVKNKSITAIMVTGEINEGEEPQPVAVDPHLASSSFQLITPVGKVSNDSLCSITEAPISDGADLEANIPAVVDINNGNMGKNNLDGSSSENSQVSLGGGGKRKLFARGAQALGPQPPVESPKKEPKPMFHAAVHVEKEVTHMTPDVYDFTGTVFNMIHDIEEHLLSIETLTSNTSFLPFVMPTIQPGTPVDRKPRGPSLEMVLRRDTSLVQVKNIIYSCIDNMYHSAEVYTSALQRLLVKYFLPQVSFPLESGSRDPVLFLESLQLLDSQLKVTERLPESQRLGMFLYDITPYKESLQVKLLARLQTMQEEINHEVILRIHCLIRKLDNLQSLVEGRPTTLDALYLKLTTTDSLRDIVALLQSREITQIANLYNIMDRFAVPHNEDERRVFESCHYMITSVQRSGELSLADRVAMVEGIDRCLDRDAAWIQTQVKKVLKPLVENPVFLDGYADVRMVRQALTYAEEMVRSYVAKANFIREIQRYLGKPESHFRELFQVSSRFVNTRNMWLLVVDWDTKLNNWKRQSFITLDVQRINKYTFKYMEACNKLEKVLPKNTVVSVFGEKMDVMLRWLNFIIEFRGQVVKPRHWRQIEEVLGVEFGEELPLTLASLMSINAIEKQKTLHVILNKARAEMNIQSEYDEVCHQCEELKLPISSKPKVLMDGEEPVTIYLMGDTFEIEESLNYCVMELERIDLSPHSGFLHNTLEQYLQRIFECLENIVTWAEMQMKLSRLRRLLLRHGDVSQTLPAEVKRYKDIYMEYSHFLEDMSRDPDVLKCCTSREIRDFIENQHNDVSALYRVIKQDIEQRGSTENREQPVLGL